MGVFAGLQRVDVFGAPEIDVWVYPDARIVHHQMHAPCRDEVLRRAFLAGLGAMQQHRAGAWLSDDRMNSVVKPDDEAWLMDVFFGLAYDSGWRRWAVVLPVRAIGALNVKRFVNSSRLDGLEAEAFSEPLAALAWLLDGPENP